jgi:sugar phosphate isomerase/epimerase
MGLRRFKFAYLFDPPKTFRSMEDFGDALRTVADLGFEGAEFSLTHPLGFELHELKSIAAAANIRIPSLLSGWSYFNESLCLCSPRQEVRELAVRRLKDYVAIAAELGAILVVGQMQGFLQDEPNEEIANDRIAAGLREVCRGAEERGVTVVMEPVNHLQVGFNCSVGEVLTMIERVGSPALRPMVDTIHMNIEEKSVTEPILRLGGGLAHVHLVETNACMFGTGHMDFPAVFKALAEIDYQGYVSVKIYRRSTWQTASVAAMQYLRSIGIVS